MTRTPYAYPLPPKAKAELDLILGHDSGEPIYNASGTIYLERKWQLKGYRYDPQTGKVCKEDA